MMIDQDAVEKSIEVINSASKEIERLREKVLFLEREVQNYQQIIKKIKDFLKE